MRMSEREHHIKVLENLLSHYKAREKCEGYYDGRLKDNVEALQYAISSLKTDLKYDLMYEGEEIYTKADIADMLKELQTEIKELWDNRYDVWLDNQYCIGKSDTLEEVDEVIQQKINKLKGE